MVEEKYGNLQEEAAGKTKKLQKINQMYKSAKAEVVYSPHYIFSFIFSSIPYHITFRKFIFKATVRCPYE